MNRTTFIVFKKELLDSFRDKKTILVGILIPLIVFPILFGFMGNAMKNTTKSVEENLKIALVDQGNSSLGKMISQQKNVKIIDSPNIQEDIKSGKILAAIEIPKDFENSLTKEVASRITVTYDNSGQQSQMAFNIINGFIGTYSKEIIAQRLTKRNIDVNILNPVIVDTKTATKESEGLAKFMLSLMLPMLLVMYSVSGPMPAATDLGAGEKERGTLEPLLTTQSGRMSLLWGKFLAIIVIGLLTTIASMAGLYISMMQKNGLFNSTGNGEVSIVSFSIGTLILIGLVSILLTMVFGALELSISIYARSFKEASTYLAPLTVMALIPTYATYMLDAKNIETFYFHIPLANAVCVIKELIAGIYNFNHLAITISWIAVYIVASLLLARFMFSREEVIFRT